MTAILKCGSPLGVVITCSCTVVYGGGEFPQSLGGKALLPIIQWEGLYLEPRGGPGGQTAPTIAACLLELCNGGCVDGDVMPCVMETAVLVSETMYCRPAKRELAAPGRQFGRQFRMHRYYIDRYYIDYIDFGEDNFRNK